MARVASDLGPCSFPGCVRGQHCKGLCGPHYEQQRRGYELRPLLETVARVCRVDGCGRDLFAVRAQLCHRHYTRQRRGFTGDDFAINPKLTPRACEWCGVEFLPKQRMAAKCCCALHPQKNASLFNRYGLRGVDVLRMLEQQHGGCAICRTPLIFDTPDRKKWANVDHDHECCPDPGKSCGRCVRGLLCWSCNSVLGLAQDDQTRLAAAIAYLAQHAT